MKLVFSIIRFISRHTWWWTVAAVIVLALLLTLARFLLPQLGRYQQELEMQVSAAIGQPISINDFRVGWHGYGPRIYLDGVRLLDRSGEKTLLALGNVRVDVSVPASIYQGKVELRALTLIGVELSVKHYENGRYTLEGVNLPKQSTTSAGGEAALDWMFRQGHLAIENSVIHWQDLASGHGALTFNGVNVHLNNQGRKHQLGGVLLLPSTMGKELVVAVEAEGDLSDLQSWDIDFYAKGSGLQLTQWFVEQSALGVRAVNGSADVEVWAQWRKNRLSEFKGDVGLTDLYLARGERVESDESAVFLIPGLFGRFVWQGKLDDWSLDVDDFYIIREDSRWPLARMHISQRFEDEVQEVEVATNFARIGDLVDLMLASSYTQNELRSLLADLAPRGDVRDAYLEMRFRKEQPTEYFLRAQLAEVGINPWKKLPGFEGLDLLVNLDRRGGVADVGGRGLLLDTQGFFRELLPLNSLLGRVAWSRVGKGWQLDLRQLEIANNDLALQIDGEIDLPDNGLSPVVKVLAEIKRGNGAATSRYLPTKIMSEKTVSWLDSAIVSGQVTSGALLLQGPIKQFPFDDGSGRFEIRFNLADGILDYTQGWPRLEQVEAEVIFVERGMKVAGRGGKIFSSDIENVSVDVPDLRAKPAVLSLEGSVHGPTLDVIRFLNQSPLQQRFSRFTEGATAKGESNLHLGLTIPLKSGEAITTQGKVVFADSEVNFKRMGVDLAHIKGAVEFTGEGLAASNVSAEIMGQPARLNIHTEELPQSKLNIVFEAKGETHFKALSQRFDLPVFPYLAGQSQWQASLLIPRRGETELAKPSLRLESSLVGTSVQYPQPLTKAAEGERPIVIVAEFDGEGSTWGLGYGGEDLTGVFELRRNNGSSTMSRGALHLGGVAQLPQEEGMSISGKVVHFDSKAWWPIMFADEKSSKESPVNHVDMAFGSAELFGQTFHEVELNAIRFPGVWSADVKSKELGGNIRVPDILAQAIEMDLSHFHFAKPSTEDNDEPIDPRELPPLNIKSAVVSYDGKNLGSMELITAQHDSGLNIESLKLKSDIAEVDLKGIWLQINKQQSAVLNSSLRIHDMGSVLGQLGYAETIKHGEGTGQANLSWQGSIFDPSLETVEGVLSFDLNNGRLLEVDPGAGRLFGLMSVQALPRRLILDFSDLFGKGLTFDYMRGKFDFKGGNAITDNFALDGPGAKVELKGRVGLVAQDYDQQVRVVPHVTSGLPLAGAVAGGVGVGAVVYLVERLFRRDIDKAAEIHYHISGGWDEPVIKQIVDEP